MSKAIKKPPRLYWDKIVKTYFDFCLDKFGEEPSFDGSSPRDLGLLLDAIQKKAEGKQMVWTEDLAVRSISVYLDFAFRDKWLQQNFLLFNLNRQKDKIFFEINKITNGTKGGNNDLRESVNQEFASRNYANR